MRNPCEARANNTLLAQGLHAVNTLSAGSGVPGGAGAGGVGHGRKEEAYANVPAWLANKPQHGIPGTDSPDAPQKGTLHGQYPALG
jgi:hypothetical protein